MNTRGVLPEVWKRVRVPASVSGQLYSRPSCCVPGHFDPMPAARAVAWSAVQMQESVCCRIVLWLWGCGGGVCSKASAMRMPVLFEYPL